MLNSAPFQLDIFKLDDRLLYLFETSCFCFHDVELLLNSQFINKKNFHTTSLTNKYSVLDNHRTNIVVYRFVDTVESPNYDLDTFVKMDKNLMVLLSPMFTEGLILINWTELRDYLSCDEPVDVARIDSNSTKFVTKYQVCWVFFEFIKIWIIL